MIIPNDHYIVLLICALVGKPGTTHVWNRSGDEPSDTRAEYAQGDLERAPIENGWVEPSTDRKGKGGDEGDEESAGGEGRWRCSRDVGRACGTIKVSLVSRVRWMNRDIRGYEVGGGRGCRILSHSRQG